MTETQKQQSELQKRIMMFIPCFWPLLPFVLAMNNTMMNVTVAYHQCPNCNNMIGSACREYSQYCTMPGTREEQIAELRQKMAVVFDANQNRRRRRRRL